MTALLVLLWFDPGAESVGLLRDSSLGSEKDSAPSQQRSAQRGSQKAGSGSSSYANKTGLWVKPGQERNVPVGRIQIPAIDIDAPYRLDAHDDIIQLGSGLWPATPFPGEAGAAVTQ